MRMDLQQAVWALEGGYCLWIGAGLTRQIAAGRATVPLWEDLAAHLENAARIDKEPGADVPTRLDRCHVVLGDVDFDATLRALYYTQLCEAVLSHASDIVGEAVYVPGHIRAVAALGQMANPIVNFNIEPITSLLVARPGGPARVMVQTPARKPASGWRELGSRFQRLVYHPHGLVMSDTVMTARQYETNRQTLAFQLAIHASFANDLAIVGMSLDDRYLRDHIERFRNNVSSVFWFNSHFPDELSSWASSHDITTVEASWDDFWNQWLAVNIELDEEALAAAWYRAVQEAAEEVAGGSLAGLGRSIARGLGSDVPGLRRIAENLVKAGRAHGEPAARSIAGRDPMDIDRALRERLIADGIAVPEIARTLDMRAASALPSVG